MYKMCIRGQVRSVKSEDTHTKIGMSLFNIKKQNLELVNLKYVPYAQPLHLFLKYQYFYQKVLKLEAFEIW